MVLRAHSLCPFLRPLLAHAFLPLAAPQPGHDDRVPPDPGLRQYRRLLGLHRYHGRPQRRNHLCGVLLPDGHLQPVCPPPSHFPSPHPSPRTPGPELKHAAPPAVMCHLMSGFVLDGVASAWSLSCGALSHSVFGCASLSFPPSAPVNASPACNATLPLCLIAVYLPLALEM